MSALTMTSRIAGLALSLALIGNTAFAAYFSDINNHWASNAIQTLGNQNIIGGYSDGTFKPEGRITRAEYSAILVKALGLSPVTPGQPSFNDVPSNNWAFTPIETVKAQGLVSGYPNGEFLPNKNISRAEALSVLVNAAHVPMPDETSANQILSRYSDSQNIPNWARPSVAAAIQSGIYEGNPSAGNYLTPGYSATRGEVAAMVENLRERSNLANNNPTNANPYQNQMQQNQMASNPNPQGALQGRVTAVPAQTKFTGSPSTPISSEINRVGDQVEINLDQPLTSSDGQQVIPVGSKLVGKVVMLEPAGRAGKPATLDINFNEIITPDGRRFQVSAEIDTEDGMLHGDTTKGRVLKAAGKTALGAGLGAALGTAMGPLSGGHVGKGAIYGTAVGAGAGAVTAAVQKGKDVTLTTTDKLEVKLTQPLTVTQ